MRFARPLRTAAVALGLVFASICADGADPAPKLKIIVPAYVYPGDEGLKHWDALIAASEKAPIVAIVNPASGPGKAVDPNYVSVLKKAKASKLTLIGYVSTNYGKVPLRDVVADVERWRTLYPGLHGFFFDEQSSEAEKVEHYAALAAHVRKASPKALIVANPGTGCDVAYFQKKTADVWCVFEAGEPPKSYRPAAWAKSWPAERFYLLSYGFADRAAIAGALKTSVEKNVGAVFLTNDALPNPWDTLPPYWDELVDQVAELNRTAK